MTGHHYLTQEGNIHKDTSERACLVSLTSPVDMSRQPRALAFISLHKHTLKDLTILVMKQFRTFLAL